jgi:hypothetical protein
MRLVKRHHPSTDPRSRPRHRLLQEHLEADIEQQARARLIDERAAQVNNGQRSGLNREDVVRRFLHRAFRPRPLFLFGSSAAQQ